MRQEVALRVERVLVGDLDANDAAPDRALGHGNAVLRHSGIHHLLRSGSVEAVDGSATDRGQRVRREEHDQLSSLMNHFGSLDGSQRSRAAALPWWCL